MAQAENQIGREVKKATVREVNQLIAYSVGDPLYDTEVKEEQQFRKRILIVDDDGDVTVTFKVGKYVKTCVLLYLNNNSLLFVFQLSTKQLRFL